ncbi:MAG: matrixin family metalloprotease [Nanoarchaeota archaeon]|nr:matrixin family metalloprotease [Nanoarchaeota archaeon]
MIWKLVGVLFVVLLLMFPVFILYSNFTAESVEFRMNDVSGETGGVISYVDVPVFSENLRFNHKDISYFIDAGCKGVRRKAMIKAFEIFEEKMDLISFYEIGGSADIDVECSEGFQISESLFAAGEGGPSRIINTSFFKTIEKGSIFLYEDPMCDYPIVELHELGHVFGFDHSEDPLNTMYNTTNCKQRISEDMVRMIDDLYSVEALADASISELSAVKTGRYLDFNITVLNEGLVGIDAISLTIYGDGEKITTMEFGEIDIGYGRTLRASNVKLGFGSIENIDFVVDSENKVRELNEGNNFVRMTT